MFQDKSNASLPDLYAYKAVDQTVTDSDVLVDSTSLSIDVKANRKYIIRAVLFVTSAEAGIKIAFGGTAVASYFVSEGIAIQRGPGSDTVFSLSSATALDEEITTDGDFIASITAYGAIEPSANGTLKIQFANGILTGDVDTTIMRKGSSLVAWRMV